MTDNHVSSDSSVSPPAGNATATDDAGFFPPKPHQRFDSQPIPLPLEKRGVTSQRFKQGQLWQKETMWRDTIVAKLREAGREDLAQPLDECHRETTVQRCCGCATLRRFWNRCELKHCPICAERLARERKETVESWTRTIKQPKHLVLTARNTEDFSENYLRWFKSQWSKLRRRKCCSGWRGGFYSIEVTWGSDGAHVHLHALIDADWINISQIAVEWGALVGQDFAIVNVSDARDSSYLQEVCKYVCKGSELATWDKSKIVRFIDALKSVRMFGVFGDCYRNRKLHREFLESIRENRNVCECGCKNFRYFDESAWAWEELQSEQLIALPPPKPAVENLTPVLL